MATKYVNVQQHKRSLHRDCPHRLQETSNSDINKYRREHPNGCRLLCPVCNPGWHHRGKQMSHLMRAPIGAHLARSMNGKVIHKLECRHARAPWEWTSDKRPDEVAASIARMGYRLCRVCRPLEVWVDESEWVRLHPQAPTNRRRPTQ